MLGLLSLDPDSVKLGVSLWILRTKDECKESLNRFLESQYSGLNSVRGDDFQSTRAHSVKSGALTHHHQKRLKTQVKAGNDAISPKEEYSE